MTTVTVFTTNGKTYEGELFAVDTVTRSLSIKTSAGSYAILNPAFIESINGTLTAAKQADLAKLGLSLHNLEQQELNALRQAERSMDSLNKNVKPEIQSLYDKLSSVFTSCRWSGNSIEILEEYLIAPPYDTVRVLENKEGAGLDRIRKILDGERRKLNL